MAYYLNWLIWIWIASGLVNAFIYGIWLSKENSKDDAKGEFIKFVAVPMFVILLGTIGLLLKTIIFLTDDEF